MVNSNITCHITFSTVIVTNSHTESFLHTIYSTWSYNIISHERLQTRAAPEMSELGKKKNQLIGHITFVPTAQALAAPAKTRRF